MIKFLLLLICIPSFAVQDVTTTKDAGFETSLQILNCKGNHEYTTGWGASSSHLGASSDQLVLHIGDAESDTEAIAMLAAIATPTSTFSSLTITVDVGTYVVADDTVITADGSEVKTVKSTVEIDDTTGALEVVVYERIGAAAYGSSPQSGNSLCADLKEYTVPASGTALTETVDWIQ